MEREQSSENELVEYALKYSRWGLRVFPLHGVRAGTCTCGQATCGSAGKHPRTKNGVKDATTEREQIQRWWQRWPDANIGIATGLYGERGLYVIDVDSAKGAQLESLEDCDLAQLLCSRLVRTGSGGYHIYLRCTDRFPNTTNKLAPFIDTRGEGGYVVAPPSQNACGAYVWETKQNPILPMPPALLARLRKLETTRSAPVVKTKEKTSEIPATTQTSEAQIVPAGPSTDAAAAASTAAVPQASVASEARNAFLVSMAGTLRRQGLNVDEIRNALLSINEARYGAGRHPRSPLALDEMERTIFKSILQWESERGSVAPKVQTVEPLSDLMSGEVPRPHWLVPDLICEGLVLLAGKPKLGKSWLALALALNCALGTANEGGLVLGCYAVEPASVLYLSLENSPWRFKEHVTQLLKGRPVPANFAYALSWSPLRSGGLEALETQLISRPETRLVVIDTLAKVRTAVKSGGSIYQEDYDLMGVLHEMVVKYQIPLIIVHHTRKEISADPFDEISGSTGLTGAADTSIVLKRERNQPDGTLYITGRDVVEQELAVTFHKDCTWTCHVNADDHQLSQSRQEILSLLKQNGPMTLAQITNALGKPYDTVKAALRRMMNRNLITKAERGLYVLSQASLFEQSENEAAD